MSIVKMKRFSLLSFEEDKEKLLHSLQKFKYVHFLNLNENEEFIELGLDAAKVPESIVEIDEELRKITYGIDSLSQYDTRPKGLKAMREGKETLEFLQLEEKALSLDYLPIYQKIKETDKHMESLKADIEQYNLKLGELLPWANLDVPIATLDSINKSGIFLGTIPKRKLPDLENALLETQYTYLEVVGEERTNCNIFAITADVELETLATILRDNNFVEVKLNISKTAAEEIKDIRSKIINMEKEQEYCVDQFKQLEKELPNLELAYDYLMNKRLRLASSENFLKAGNVGIIEGYVPEEKLDEFTEIVRGSLANVYYLELEEVEEDDEEVPILLENSKFTKPFENLTQMYAFPRYNEIDPTPFLAFFHILFVGMMIADFGYGLLLFVGCFTILKFFNLAEEQKISIRFFLFAGISTMFWGVIFGSFFGKGMPTPALIDPMTEYNTLLVVAIALGVVHIFYALGIQAYMHIKKGKPWEALYDAGFWYMALGGAIVLALVYVDAVSSSLLNPAKWIMIIGMVGIVLTGGRDSDSIIGKLGGGVYSLYGITGYIGDFVSYSRLMALGLSGGYIAYAINLMVGMLMGLNVIGAAGGIVLFIGGHLFNLFLSALSGYVHTIRLTFVEFFGKFYEGGGKPFKKFISKTKYINLK